jgi:predicted metalloprotease
MVGMRWQGERESENVEDRRGRGGGRVAIGGAGLLVVLVVSWLLGVDPRALLQQLPQGGASLETPQTTAPQPAADDSMKQFIGVVLAETEDVWHEQFRRMGREYVEPKLVLFTDQVESACGIAGAAVGPFYCPADDQVYLDLGFFELLDRRLGAPGDFAQAYVVAHEVGHHVQDLLGISDRVAQLRERMSEEEANALSVRVELQADFYAGIWAHYTARKDLLDPGDIEEGLRAAAAIGDDRLQRQSQGYVVPDAFTHGTSEQRVRWFKLGYETGDPSRGNTFEATAL